MSRNSASVGFCPRVLITVPNSFVVTVPSPSLSRSGKASLNSAIRSSVGWSAMLQALPTSGTQPHNHSARSLHSDSAAAAKSLQSCPTLCDPTDGSAPGSPVPGILQARILEWAAISFSNAWKWKVKVKSLSHVQLLATPWSAAYQAPLSLGFSRQEYWSGLPFFSNAWKWRVKVNVLSCVQLLATPWTVAYQVSPFMGFSRQENWSGVPLPSPPLGL